MRLTLSTVVSKSGEGVVTVSTNAKRSSIGVVSSKDGAHAGMAFGTRAELMGLHRGTGAMLSGHTSKRWFHCGGGAFRRDGAVGVKRGSVVRGTPINNRQHLLMIHQATGEMLQLLEGGAT